MRGVAEVPGEGDVDDGAPELFPLALVSPESPLFTPGHDRLPAHWLDRLTRPRGRRDKTGETDGQTQCADRVRRAQCGRARRGGRPGAAPEKIKIGWAISKTGPNAGGANITQIPNYQVFQPDALKEVYLAGAPTDDERYYVPFTDTVSSRPLWISPSQNKWCHILMAKSAGLVNRHYHPHEVFAYTISGKWGYLEHDWTATAGDFVYETPGESHTLVAYQHKDPMKVSFIVKGPLIWLDDEGEPAGHFDVHQYIALCRAHDEKNGIGSAYIDRLFR